MRYPRISASAVATPSRQYTQDEISTYIQQQTLGARWQDQPATAAQGEMIAQTFAATHVRQRHSVVDLATYYHQRRTTGERMRDYQGAAAELGAAALQGCITDAQAVSDLVVVSCTGYAAPGLDIVLGRDLGMARDIRRVCVGHMGCFGALVGLRQGVAALAAHPEATAAVLSVELCSLHFAPSSDPEVLTSFALFGDAAAAITLTNDAAVQGPEIVATYCAADFATADQMSWTITDEGFMMGLSPRVPVTLSRNIKPVMEQLLGPHGLTTRDITHWLVHPGGPSILEAIQRKLELAPEQLALAWDTLRDYGNCSSATVLIMLDALMRSGTARRGEWGVMMAFGPGLTLETCLMRF